MPESSSSLSRLATLQGRQAGVGAKIFAGIMLGLAFHFLNRLFSHLGLLYDWPPFSAALLPTAMRAMNLTGVIMFLIGSVGVFQFLAANMYWPQKITDTIVGWGLTPLGFIFAYMGVLLILGMFATAADVGIYTAAARTARSVVLWSGQRCEPSPAGTLPPATLPNWF